MSRRRRCEATWCRAEHAWHGLGRRLGTKQRVEVVLVGGPRPFINIHAPGQIPGAIGPIVNINHRATLRSLATAILAELDANPLRRRRR